MAVLYRRAKTAITILLVVLLCLFSSSWTGIGGGKGPQIQPAIPLEDLEAHLERPVDFPTLVEDAHTLSAADLFLQHFKAVTQMKGVTMEEAKAGCNWLVPDAVNFQFDKDVEWVVEDRPDIQLDLRRKQWHDFIDNDLLPWELYKDRFLGRGIIIIAENGKSINGVKVIIRALKRLGSTMPIEVHHFAAAVSEEVRKEVLEMWPKTFFNDLSADSNILPSKLDKLSNVTYQLHTAAIINSRFVEPLLLDSDNIPVVDPESLYETPTYQEYGTIFWPDITRTRPNNPMWVITNTQCRMNEYEQESGQVLVDKRRFFYHLQLAAWLNNQQGTYYNEFLLGDKDMFRFAWHALKTKYGAPSRYFSLVGLMMNNQFCGHTFAQNHPNGSVAFMHGSSIERLTSPVVEWLRDGNGGIHHVYKIVEHDEDASKIEQMGVRWDDVIYLPNRTEDQPAVRCMDFFDAESKSIDDIVPNFEKTFDDIGGY